MFSDEMVTIYNVEVYSFLEFIMQPSILETFFQLGFPKISAHNSVPC